ncbi:hypothetical protein ES15_1780 [Cronobacter sakazakii ES15]|nr:hypothetical protein ES15_1780 [Cronobacter sakazakii ES15]
MAYARGVFFTPTFLNSSYFLSDYSHLHNDKPIVEKSWRMPILCCNDNYYHYHAGE